MVHTNSFIRILTSATGCHFNASVQRRRVSVDRCNRLLACIKGNPFKNCCWQSFPRLARPCRRLNNSLPWRKTIEQIYHAAGEIQAQYGCIVIATFGAKGALAISGDSALYIEPPKVNVRSSAGAGDAILAGVAHALGEKLPLEDGLKLGFAAAASVLTTLATADCIQEDVYSFMKEVQIREYPPN